MRVLVAYGSKHGGTEGIARAVGEALSEVGHDVDVRPGHRVDGLGPWDAVIVGGALYAGFWQRGARRFVSRHLDELRRMPVWFFSSGPLDHSANENEIPPTAMVAKWMRRVGARGHVTFGGRLDPDAKGPIARALAEKGMVGDFRDMERVRAWAGQLPLTAAGAASASNGSPARDRRERRIRLAMGALAWFTGVTAVVGGLALVVGPSGGGWMPPPEVALRGTPFADYFVPGLLLLLAVAAPNLVAGVHAVRRDRNADLAGGVAGGALSVWIAIEMVLFHPLSWLQVFYLAIGVVTFALAVALRVVHRRNLQGHRVIPLPGSEPSPA